MTSTMETEAETPILRRLISPSKNLCDKLINNKFLLKKSGIESIKHGLAKSQSFSKTSLNIKS